ncbi:MAG TPA: hypothetical protein VI699_12380, partial [Candidatus Acidoferrales bacterium]|nr:hypothetical protein [Candidatus Acidoferrales bacterium]
TRFPPVFPNSRFEKVRRPEKTVDDREVPTSRRRYPKFGGVNPAVPRIGQAQGPAATRRLK